MNIEKPTFKHLCFMYMQQLTNFPYIEKDFDAITDYQLLCRVVNYLNQVIENSNEQNTAITNLYNAFIALKDYVDTYFDENFPQLVNDKIDELVEDGTLENILHSRLNIITIYDTFQDVLTSSNTLVDGLTIETLGYYTINDGGRAYYKITDTEDENEYQEEVGELYATLMPINNQVYAEQFGIVGDTTDNSNCNEKLIIALNYASTHNCELNFMRKTYTCYSIPVPQNTRINGNGCMFKKPNFLIAPYNLEPNVYGNYGIFILEKQTSNTELKPTFIRDCTFDGNCWEIWDIEQGYAQQQGSLIKLFGNYQYTSRIKAFFYNVIVQNCASDGFHIRDNSDVYIENAKSYECFRGGLTCTGGGSLVKVNGFEFNGNLVKDGIDLESDSQSTELNEYFFTNITINNDLDLGVPLDNAIVTIDNMISKGECLIRGTSKGVYISNSHFKISDPTKNFSFTSVGEGYKNLIFDNCIFEGAKVDDEDTGTYINLQSLYEGSETTQIKVITKFINCQFKNIRTISGGPVANGEITFDGCDFDSTIFGTYAIGEGIITNQRFSPKILNIRNCTFNNSGYALFGTGSTSRICLVNFENNNFTNSANQGIRVYRSLINFNQIFKDYGFGITWHTDHKKRLTGKRIIMTTDTTQVPTSSTPGVNGDDQILIFSEDYVTILAKFVYDVETKTWTTIFNNIQ